MSYTIASVSGISWPAPDANGMIYEDITVTGSGDTTGTYTTKFVKQPQYVLGGFIYSFSGQVATLSGVTLTGTMAARIVGYP